MEGLVIGGYVVERGARSGVLKIALEGGKGATSGRVLRDIVVQAITECRSNGEEKDSGKLLLSGLAAAMTARGRASEAELNMTAGLALMAIVGTTNDAVAHAEKKSGSGGVDRVVARAGWVVLLRVMEDWAGTPSQPGKDAREDRVLRAIRRMLQGLKGTAVEEASIRRLAVRALALSAIATKSRSPSRDDDAENEDLALMLELGNSLFGTQNAKNLQGKVGQLMKAKGARMRKSEAMENVVSISMMQGALLLGARLLKTAGMSILARNLAVDVLKTAPMGAGIASMDPVTARHALAIVASEAKERPNSIAPLFGPVIKLVLAQWTGTETASKGFFRRSQARKFHAINLGDVLGNLYFCRILGGLIYKGFEQKDEHNEQSIAVLEILCKGAMTALSDDRDSAIVIFSAIKALAGEGHSDEIRKLLYGRLTKSELKILLTRGLPKIVSAGTQTECVAACDAFKTVAESATRGCVAGNQFREDFGPLIDSLRLLMIGSSSPYVQFAAATALVWVPVNDTDDSFHIMVAKVLSGLQQNRRSQAWPKDLTNEIFTTWCNVVSVSPDSCSDILSSICIIAKSSPDLLSFSSGLIDLWNAIARIESARLILLNHLLTLMRITEGASTTDADMEEAYAAIQNNVIWYLGENANFITSIYAWNDLQLEKTVKITGRLRGPALTVFSYTRSCELHSCIAALGRMLSSAPWNLRVSTGIALGKIGLRSCEPFRFHCYNTLCLAGREVGVSSIILPAMIWLEKAYRKQNEFLALMERFGSNPATWSDAELESLFNTHVSLIEAASSVCFVPPKTMIPLGPGSKGFINECRRRRGEEVEEEEEPHDTNSAIMELADDKVVTAEPGNSHSPELLHVLDASVPVSDAVNNDLTFGASGLDSFAELSDPFADGLNDPFTASISSNQPGKSVDSPLQLNDPFIDILSNTAGDEISISTGMPYEHTNGTLGRKQMTVIKRYVAEDSSHMSVGVGEALIALSSTDDGHILVERSGSTGLVPTNCLIDTKDYAGDNLVGKFAPSGEGIMLYDFNAIDSGELDTARNENVIVESDVGQGWYFVTKPPNPLIGLGGGTAAGLVPAGYVMPCAVPDVFASLM